MIEELSLENFRAFTSAHLGLGRLTVIVGPNGSGKTSLLEAIHYLARLGDEPGNDVFQGNDAGKWLVRSGCERATMGLSLSVPGLGPARVDVALRPFEEHPNSPHDSVGSPLEAKFRQGDCEIELDPSHRHQASRSSEAHDADRNQRDRETLAAIANVIEHTDFLRLDPRRLARPSYSDATKVKIESDGTGLSTVIADMILKDRQHFSRLQEAVRRIIPGLREIRVDRVPTTREISRSQGRGQPYKSEVQTVRGELLLIDTDSGQGIPAWAVSEGTLLAIGFLTVLMGPQPTKLVLIDDLDRGLHPLAQRELVQVLRGLLERDPELQIVATSHAPYLLDCLEFDEVRVTALRDDGVAVLGNLGDHPEFEKWQRLMTPGELWSSLGERWLAELGGEAS